MRLIDKIKQLLGMKSKDYGVSIDSSISLNEIPRAWPKVGDCFKITNMIAYVVISVDKDKRVVKVAEKDDMDKTISVNIDTFDELFTPTDLKLNYPL